MRLPLPGKSSPSNPLETGARLDWVMHVNGELKKKEVRRCSEPSVTVIVS